MKKAGKFTTKDLKLINSKSGLLLLLQQTKPDFEATCNRLKHEQKVRELQTRLIKMQAWIVKRNKRLIILFEGRDFAGKSNTIRRFTEHLNPRNMRIVALTKPTAIEKRQWYFRRYIQEFPNPGEIVFLDRSWYNRAMVEPVNKFCSRNKYEKFMNEVNQFEEIIMNDGIQLIKFYFSINKEEQVKRLNETRNDQLKKWKLTEVDEKAIELWDQYTVYKERMFAETDRNNSPWIVLDANDNMKACVYAMEYVLSQVQFQ